jgi:RNA polymerase sigma-70 factor (ECF subfamily)
MADPSPETVQLQRWLQRMEEGDAAASEELFRHLGERMQRLTRQMLNRHPAIRRWTESNDVFQGAVVRLCRALRDVRPDSMRAFFALATQQIRRELIDLARHYYGPHGLGANHASRTDEPHGPPVAGEPPDTRFEPGGLAEWCEFHEQIERLPDDEREVVDLLFYQGLTQAEAAELLQVNVRTVQRRWHAALVKLHDVLQGQWPES